MGISQIVTTFTEFARGGGVRITEGRKEAAISNRSLALTLARTHTATAAAADADNAREAKMRKNGEGEGRN